MGGPIPSSGEIPIELAPGTLVGEYEVGKLLGKGGFGMVYAAVHPLIGKHVAIKVLTLRYSVDRAMVSRFIAEARAVNQIRHQHIIDIFSFGKLPDGRQYYVMELLEGETLDRYLRERGRLPVDEAVQILHPIALALDAAHGAGIAHRDLKPENVFIARDAMGQPFPKLLDFGLAKLMSPSAEVEHSTQSGLMMGTPHYMSPEQCRGRDVDHRTDLYALGAMTYQLLVGRVPFTGLDHMDIIFKQINDQPRAPSQLVPGLSTDIDEAVLALLAKDVDDRPDTAIDAISAIAVGAGLAKLPSASNRPVVRLPPATLSAPRGEATANLRKGDQVSTIGVDTPTAAPEPTPSLPPKHTSLPMGQVTPSSPPSRRGVLYVGVAIVLAVGGIAAWKISGSSHVETAKALPGDAAVTVAIAPPGDAAAIVADAAAVDAAPALITVRLDGAPAGTKVIGPDNKVLVTLPGDFQVPPGAAVPVRLERAGYDPLSITIRPASPAMKVTLSPHVVRPSERVGDFGK